MNGRQVLGIDRKEKVVRFALEERFQKRIALLLQDQKN